MLPTLLLLAYDPAALQARLDATAALRAQRLYTDAPTIPASAYARAASGEVMSGVVSAAGHPPRSWAVGIIDVGIGDLWDALNDETHHAGITPLAYAAVLRGQPCADDRYAMMVLPVPVLSDRWLINHNRYNTAVSRATNGAVRELTWTAAPDPSAFTLPEAARPLVDGAVYVSFNSGAWWLVSLDEGHTLAEYASSTDPGGNVPAGPATSFAAGNLDQTYAAMERYAKSGKLPCKGRD